MLKRLARSAFCWWSPTAETFLRHGVECCVVARQTEASDTLWLSHNEVNRTNNDICWSSTSSEHMLVSLRSGNQGPASDQVHCLSAPQY